MDNFEGKYEPDDMCTHRSQNLHSGGQKGCSELQICPRT